VTGMTGSSISSSSSATLRLGTRRSALATTQSAWVADRLRALGHTVELVEIVTEGDTSTASLATLGGTGVFAAALRRALLAGEVDLAVHSLKDLPTWPEPGLALAAVPGREDPRDVLVSGSGATLGELPVGAVIGTGSPRRVAQLAALGLGLEFKDIRGNVDTRIAMTRDGALDAVVLARAGLARLDRLDDVAETLDPLQVLPAPGQGALAVECRADDTAPRAVLAALDDLDTRVCVTAERALLSALEAGCSAPVGALAEVVEGEDGLELSMRAFVGTTDGTFDLRRSLVGPLPASDRDGALASADALGRRLAAVLLEDGAGTLSSPGTRDALDGPEERPPADGIPPDPALATGDDPLAAPDRRPEIDSTERAL
jgi:hydroxymethylbilane synthase